jgi:hypothetical protein
LYHHAIPGELPPGTKSPCGALVIATPRLHPVGAGKGGAGPASPPELLLDVPLELLDELDELLLEVVPPLDDELDDVLPDDELDDEPDELAPEEELSELPPESGEPSGATQL